MVTKPLGLALIDQTFHFLPSNSNKASADLSAIAIGLARLLWRAFSSLPGPFARMRWGSGSRAMNAV